MRSILFTAAKYLHHQWSAIGAHGIHSPFVYELFQQVVKKRNENIDPSIESLRNDLVKSRKHIDYSDFKTGLTESLRLGDIARTSPSHPGFSAFLQRLCDFLEIQRVLETGTSLGINALYLAGGETVERVVTLEGNTSVATIAESMTTPRTDKVAIRQGNIYDLFPVVLQTERPQLVFWTLITEILPSTFT